MRKSQRTRWMVGVAAVVASFAMVALSPLTSLAATTKSNASSQTSDNGLQISPTRTDMSVNPGGTASFQLAIKNVTSIALIAKATLNDFESNNINGQPQLLTKPGEHSPRSLKPYLQGLTNLTLQSGQTKTVQLYVAVPKDTAPGGYYGAVRFTAQPVTPAKNVGSKRISLTASVASLVLMEV
ncbi:MAG TPA: hypothetical protein VFW90_00635, partial [Candidatus Saccharimonadales bacterium]|nr:hypothetical protein [Candidatus Saccharimonadales bacterium]